jgi:acyl-coenzyme A thioesterase PaaI-like protein
VGSDPGVGVDPAYQVGEVIDPETEDAAVVLGESIRRLMSAAVLTGLDAADRIAIAAEIDQLTERLSVDLRAIMPWPAPESMARAMRPFSPVIGTANPLAPPMTVENLSDGTVIGQVTFEPIHEGPPGGVHGGWVASVLDQLLGHANAAAGAVGMTAELTVRYRRRTPYGVPLQLRARNDSIDGRRVHSSGEIVADGVVTAEATGFFLQPSAARIAQIKGILGAPADASADGVA